MRQYHNDYDDDNDIYYTEPFEYDYICIIEGDCLNRVNYYTEEEFWKFGLGEALTFHYLKNKSLFDLENVQRALSDCIPHYDSYTAYTIDNVTVINTSGQKILLNTVDKEVARIYITQYLMKYTNLGDFEEILDEIMNDYPML